GQIELPGGEPLAYLGDRGAQDASLLRRRRGAETEAGRLHFRREPRLAALLRQEPGGPVTGEDDAGQQIAPGGGGGRASARVESRNAAAQERPRKRHVARAITRDEPERGAHRFVLRLLQVARPQIKVELVVERSQRGDVRLDRHVAVERRLAEGMI